MAKTLVPPKHLSKEAAALYVSAISEYGIEDTVGRKHVEMGCEALDRLRQAQAILKTQGLTSRDRNNISRPHPAITIERNCRAAYAAAFKLLKLEPPEVK